MNYFLPEKEAQKYSKNPNNYVDVSQNNNQYKIGATTTSPAHTSSNNVGFELISEKLIC